jgi:hypothetical protein
MKKALRAEVQTISSLAGDDDYIEFKFARATTAGTYPHKFAAGQILCLARGAARVLVAETIGGWVSDMTFSGIGLLRSSGADQPDRLLLDRTTDTEEWSVVAPDKTACAGRSVLENMSSIAEEHRIEYANMPVDGKL